MKNARGAPVTQLDKVNQESNRLPRSTEIHWEGISGALSIEARFGQFAGKGCRQSVMPWRLKEYHGATPRGSTSF
jgi:hypothetical protein